MSKGIRLAIFTAIISGFSIFFAKIFVSKMDPVVFTTAKNILVAVVVSGLLIRPKLRQSLQRLTRNDWIKLVLIGIIGGSIPFALFFTGLTMTTAATGAIIHKTLFIWVAFLAVIFLKEKISLIQLAGYLMVIWAALGISGIKALTMGRGELLIVAATILWAGENVIAKIALRTIPSEIVVWGRMFMGAIVLLLIVVWQGKMRMLFSLSQQNLQAILIGAAFLTAYGLTWYKALAKAPASVATAVLTMSTIITALLSKGMLSQHLPAGEVLSFVLTISGVFFIIWFAQKRRLKSHWLHE